MPEIVLLSIYGVNFHSHTTNFGKFTQIICKSRLVKKKISQNICPFAFFLNMIFGSIIK